MCYGRDMTDAPPLLLSRLTFDIEEGRAFPRNPPIDPKDFERFAEELLPYERDSGIFDAVRREGSSASGFRAGARWIVGPCGLKAGPGKSVCRCKVIRSIALNRPYGLELPPDMVRELGEGFTLERHGILWYAFPMTNEAKNEAPASVDVVIHEMSEAPPAELPYGLWGWKAEELPPGAILVYRAGTWYRSGRGVEFCFAEPPRMVTGRPGYWVGKVLMRDGRVCTLIWGTQTRELTWWERFSADHFGRKQVVK